MSATIDVKEKEQWISNKIAKLITEGYNQEQAIAVANSMWEKEHPADGCKPEPTVDNDISSSVNSPEPNLDSVTSTVDRIDYYDYDPTTVFKKTPEGYLVGRAVITSIGVFKYQNADGSPRYEYRPASEVFNEDSMLSFCNKPITNNHPKVMVTAENINQYSVGMTGSLVTDNAYYLVIDMTITDPEAIKVVEGGKTSLSCGYRCDLDYTAGIEFGVRYDCIQRNIRGNHVSIVDAARQGDSAKIRMDSVHISISEDNEMAENMKSIRIDGVDYQAEAKVLESLHTQTERADAAEASVKDITAEKSKIEAERDNLKERADALDSELAALKANHVDADKVAEMVKSRVKLEAVCAKVGVEVKADAADVELMKAVILAKKPKAVLDGKDEIYIKNRFDGVVEDMAVEQEKNDDAAVRIVQGVKKADGEDKPVSISDARKRYQDSLRSAYKNKE